MPCRAPGNSHWLHAGHGRVPESSAQVQLQTRATHHTDASPFNFTCHLLSTTQQQQIREFILEVRRVRLSVFAPAGRDVYSLTHAIVLRSVGAQQPG